MLLTRRHILWASAAALALPEAVYAAGSGPAPAGRLVVVLLRGGWDGLYAMAPAESRLAELRPTLSAELMRSGVALGTSGFTAHPSAQILANFYQAGELAFAPCAGTLDQSRSHFQAQDLLELGTGAIRGTTGFLARAANALPSPYAAVGFTQETPLALRGAQTQAEIIPLSGSGLKMPTGRLLEAVRAAHQGLPTGAALEQAIATQTEIDMSTGMDPTAARGAAGASYLLNTMSRMGQVLRRNRRIALSFVDVGGVDTHAGEDNTQARFLPALGEGLNALKEALGDDEWRRTQVLVMTEFGRTARENGTRGTDHGHGSLALMIGGALPRKGMLGGFDGLAESALHERRDLPVRLDWRDLLAGALRDTVGYTERDLDTILPGRPRQWA